MNSEKADNKTKKILNKILFFKDKPSQIAAETNQLSWEFILDYQGRYLNISPEVKDCLGISQNNFMDQSIFDFSITPSSGSKLKELFSSQKFPIELDVIFTAVNGDLFFCNLKLTKYTEEYQSHPTFIGLVQTTETQNDPVFQTLDQSLPELEPSNNHTDIETFNTSFYQTKKEADITKRPSLIEISEPKKLETYPVVNESRIHISDGITENLKNFTLEVNHLIDPIEIYKITFDTINEFIPNDNLILGIIEKQKPEMTIPIRKINDNITYFPEDGLYLPVLNSIIQSNHLVDQMDNFSAQNLNYLSDSLRKFPKSILGFPAKSGKRTLGVILLFDENDKNRFTEHHAQYLTSIGNKMAVALENAFLFQEMQNALTAIEVREQYQVLITQALKNISNYGSKQLYTSLELIGKAANIERVFFAKSNFKNNVNSWTIQTQWFSQEKYDPFHLSPEIRSEIFEEFLSVIKEKGYLNLNIENLDREIDGWFRNRSTRSILILAVRSDSYLPNLIVLEDLKQDHYWMNDEIRFLELVADILSNTISREEEVESLNDKLLETATFHIIKDQFNEAETIEDILSIVMNYIFSIDMSNSFFYRIGEYGTTLQDHYEILARWSKEPEIPSPLNNYIFDRSTVTSLFHQEFPTYISQVQNSNLPKRILAQFSYLNTPSLAIIPVKTKNMKIGSIVAFSDSVHEFTTEEQNLIEILIETISNSTEKIINNQASSLGNEENLFFKKLNATIKEKNLRNLVEFLVEFISKDLSSQCGIFLLQKNELSNEDYSFELTQNLSINKITNLDEIWRSSQFNDLCNELIHQNSDHIEDLTSLPLDVDLLPLLNQSAIKSSHVFPISNQESIIAYLVLLVDEKLPKNSLQINYMRYALNEIGILIEIEKLNKDLDLLSNRVINAATIVRETSAILDLDSLLTDIATNIQKKFNFLYTSIHICNNELGFLDKVAVAYEGSNDPKLSEISGKDASYLLINDVFEKGQPVIFDDMQELKEFNSSSELNWTKSQIVLPLKIGEKIIGVLDIHSSIEHDFEPKNVQFFQLLSDQIAIEVENARLYEKSANTVEEISDIDRIKSQFLANMSHEFRTPLNSIIGFSKVILTGIDGPINETQKQDLTAIHNAGQYLLRLVNDILDITKIEAGSMKLNMVKTSIPDLIQSLLPAFINMVENKIIAFELNIDEEIPELTIDKDRISQVIMNLVSNAVKFTEYGKITIATSAKKTKDKLSDVIITITDTGIGISKNDQEKLFKPFEQSTSLENSRVFGTGLGLAISKSLVQLHQGQIGLLKSSPGEGSTFYISLPIN